MSWRNGIISRFRFFDFKMLLKTLDILIQEVKRSFGTGIIFLKAYFFFLPIVATAQVDTTLKDFFPMHIGDYWEYEMLSDAGNSYVRWFHRVIGDTIMPNGKRYFTVLESDINSSSPDTIYHFYRIDDSLQVFKYLETGECSDLEMLRFKLSVPDSAVWETCTPPDYPFRLRGLLATYDKYYAIMGRSLATRTYCDVEYDSTTNEMIFCPIGPPVAFLARELGIAGWYFEASGDAYLVGAIIDGNQYGTITNVKQENATSAKSGLFRNYPNPFNPETTIVFELERAGHVRLSIFNLLGQEITVLIDGEKAAGQYSISWDGSDRTGNKVSGGLYIYRLTGRTFDYTGRLMLLR
ncbi:MAG: T9SS type A sorting domain-containing protein [Ignavibacteriae bacterium]|nr:T9SS type A sorting domain-containing protein [Ignavibacteriota bacterium]